MTPPPDADTLARQGVQAHSRNDLATAERCYREAPAASPEHPLALHYLGVVLLQRRRLDAALPLLDHAATPRARGARVQFLRFAPALASKGARVVAVLLPFAPDWRWLVDRDDSAWYPTVTLFRQRAPGDWSHPIRSIAAALQERSQRGDR